MAPLNAIKNQGKEEGTVDNPFDPAELPGVAAADKACRTAMRFMRKLDRLRGNFDPPRRRGRRDGGVNQKCRDGGPRGLRRGRAPRRGARRRRRGAVGLRPGRAGRDRELGGAQVRGARRVRGLEFGHRGRGHGGRDRAGGAQEGVERAAARSSRGTGAGPGPAARRGDLPRASWTSSSRSAARRWRTPSTTTNPRRGCPRCNGGSRRSRTK